MRFGWNTSFGDFDAVVDWGTEYENEDIRR
jgi:hypothetical protein